MTYIAAALRHRIHALSGGCCEYCRLFEESSPTSFQFEHIIAESHGGQTTEQNLAFSCPDCNRYKGPNIAAADPETGKPTFLFHPRDNSWHEHFSLKDGIVVPLTPEARVTIFVLKINLPERVNLRRMLSDVGEYPCFKDDTA